MEENHSTEIKLSVALCTFNGERFLREQLDSIAAQTLKVDEVIACDDGSTDDTVSILREYADKGILPIQIIENEQNLGYSANFEQAIMACNGDFIFCCDQDDIWLPYKMQTMIDYLQSHPDIEFLFSDAMLIDREGKFINGKRFSDYTGLSSMIGAWNAGLKFEICNTYGFMACGCMSCLRKGLKNYCFLPDRRLDFDWQMSMVALKNETLVFLNIPLIKYRLHGNNTCGIGQAPYIYGHARSPKWNKRLKEPYLNPFFSISSTPLKDTIKERMDFMRYRYLNVQSIKGRITILFSLNKYLRFYKQYFYLFYFGDLFSYIPHCIKKHLHLEALYLSRKDRKPKP